MVSDELPVLLGSLSAGVTLAGLSINANETESMIIATTIIAVIIIALRVFSDNGCTVVFVFLFIAVKYLFKSVFAYFGRPQYIRAFILIQTKIKINQIMAIYGKFRKQK